MNVISILWLGLYNCRVKLFSDKQQRYLQYSTLDIRSAVGRMFVPWLLMSFLVFFADCNDSITCPNGISACPHSQTCCLQPSGHYGCCPLPQAVCCNDHMHCCPKNYKCDLKTRTCDKQGYKIPMLEHKEARSLLKDENIIPHSVQKHLSWKRVVCPGGYSFCSDGETCCSLGRGEYACCPMKDAVCCKDDVHCCPNGYTCDTSAGGCVRNSQKVPFQKKFPAKSIKSLNVESVKCPNGKSECPDGSTCCSVEGGDYGCCPMPSAVCCADKQHCCPHGFTCNIKESKCILQEFSIPMLRKVASINVFSSPYENFATNIYCPDKKSACPDSFTCCMTKTGHWGCCPLRNATCCNDREHCCPQGTKCDLKKMKCVMNIGNMAPLHMALKVNGMQNKIEATKCPDGISQCPTGYTCCLLSTGMYGCCPYRNAVCCSDHIHCCPSGTRCDTTSRMCLRAGTTALIPINQKVEAKTSSGNVICPDGTSFCASGQTCCKLSSGSYGCCPLPNAVCCSDGVHCCPSGTTCDVSQGTCLRGNSFVSMVKKVEAKTSSGNVICPDGTSFCASGQTCCKLSSGSYGCCPLPNAVCCSDGVHCCPNGYSCNQGFCIKGLFIEKAINKISAKKIIFSLLDKTVSKKVQCPDKETFCLSGTSCCLDKDNETYSCCPIKHAVCCEDHVHCCPSGWSCDIEQGTCRHEKTKDKIPLLVKSAGKKTQSVQKKKNKDPYIRF